ncbi:MAG: hypothetical protein QM613_00280 [Micrococcaceae bacterium]
MSKFTKANKLQHKEVQDKLYAEEDLLIFIDGKIYRLEGLGAIIWDVTKEPKTFAEITKYIVTTVGEPPNGEATELVVSALEKLIEAELITIS